MYTECVDSLLSGQLLIQVHSKKRETESCVVGTDMVLKALPLLYVAVSRCSNRSGGVAKGGRTTLDFPKQR